MEQFCGLLGLPRHITWPVGFAVFLLLLALVATLKRKRSETWAATSVQAWVGFAVMVAISGLIFAMLPGDFYERAAEAASSGKCEAGAAAGH